MTTINQLIRRELLNIEAIKDRRAQCQDEGNHKRAEQCHQEYKSLMKKFDETLGDYWLEHDKMLIEYGLLTITSTSRIGGNISSIDWNKEFQNYSNSLN
jgi:hypothetical protein